jgi:hypothetical protein
MRRTKLKLPIIVGFVIVDVALFVPAIIFAIRVMRQDESAGDPRAGRHETTASRTETPVFNADVSVDPSDGSIHLPLHQPLPDFELTPVNGESRVRLKELAKDKPTILVLSSFT